MAAAPRSSTNGSVAASTSIVTTELRLQQDAVPGLVVPIHFTAEKIGQYEIVCTQLCGLGHSRMHSYLNVVSDADYEAFLKSGGQ